MTKSNLMTPVEISNNTFNGGNGTDQSWNSCVGDNGYNDTFTYAEGYLAGAELLLNDIITNHGSDVIDISIYPIIYCARHGMELVFKAVLNEVKDIKPSTKVLIGNIFATHDLLILWNELKTKLPLIDRRFNDHITKLDPSVQDYAQVDSTGQVFRYPTDINTNKKHLVKTSVINLLNFKTCFTKLKDQLDDFHYSAVCIREEYALGTWTSKLSRTDLKAISCKLPPCDKWGEDIFTQTKKEICSEYDLSSNDYMRALNKIKEHHEFSSNIGKEIPISYVDETIINTILGKNEDDILALPIESIAAISNLIEIGKFRYPCESFNFLWDKHHTLAEHDKKDGNLHETLYAIDNPYFNKWLKRGLKAMGNKTLLALIP